MQAPGSQKSVMCPGENDTRKSQNTRIRNFDIKEVYIFLSLFHPWTNFRVLVTDVLGFAFGF